MIIADSMPNWATTGVNCIGAISISNASFSGTTVSVKIRNFSEKESVTDIKATIEYSDPAKNRQINIRDYNASDSLSPGAITWLVYDTGSTARPLRISVTASNCVKYAAVLMF